MEFTKDQIQNYVLEHIKLINVDGKGMAESKERSAQFLVAQSILLAYLESVDRDLASYGVLKDANYAKAIGSASGKNVTEKKINVAEDQEFMEVRRIFEEKEAIRDWVKGHIKIFENAHILFRNLSKE